MLHASGQPRPDPPGARTQARAFSLHTRAAAAGGHVTADDAIREAQAAALKKIGRGGLGEGAFPLDGDGGEGMDGGRHEATGVAATTVIRQPCEAEQVLRALLQHLRLVRLPSSLEGK